MLISKNNKRSKKYIKKYIILGLILINLGYMIYVNLNYSLMVNTTYSLDNLAFWVKKKQLPSEPGQYVAFTAPNNKLYEQPFVKIVAGLPGDVIEINNRTFYINGKEICKAKEFSKTGEKLEITKEGIIPAGKYFMYSTNKDSYDSRYSYIGLVDESNIIGVATPIL
jgi:conjugal transfer pilin signal peptidase TrbI